MKTTFTVTETYTVTANTLHEVEAAISTNDFSDVELEERKLKIEPNI